jgi:hypothetical protein
MIVLGLIAAWIVFLSLVVSVCASARTGDAQLLHGVASSRETRAERSAREADAGTIRVAARAGAQLPARASTAVRPSQNRHAVARS